MVSNFELTDLKHLQRTLKSLKKYDLQPFVDNISICEAYYYAQEKDFSKASILYEKIYSRIKKQFLKNRSDYLTSQNYQLVTLSVAFHYFSVGDSKKAIEYVNELIRYSDLKKRPNEYAMVLNNAGTAFLIAKDYKSALNYYNKASVILKNIGNQSEYDWSVFCKALVLLRTNKNSQALMLIDELRKYNTSEGVKYENVEWQLVEIIRAEILLESGNIDAAQLILNRLIKELDKGFLNEQDEGITYKLSYELYKMKGDFKKALWFHEKWKKNESEYDKYKAKESVNLQLKFVDLEKKRMKEQVEQLAYKRENDIRLTNERLLYIVFGVIIVVISLTLYRAVRTTTRLKILNQQKVESTEKIAASLAEKEVLLKEIHHRVKNNFQIISSLLSIQSSSLDEEKYAEPLNEAKTRIHSMALIHQQMYSKRTDYASIDFKNYIETLLDHLVNSYGAVGMKLTKVFDIDPLPIDLEKAIPIGLFCNEVFTNAFKYGMNENKELHLSVSLKKLDKSILLKIKDHGPGFGSARDSLKSIGKQLKGVLSQQLDGKLVEYNDDGAVVELHIGMES